MVIAYSLYQFLSFIRYQLYSLHSEDQINVSPRVNTYSMPSQLFKVRSTLQLYVMIHISSFTGEQRVCAWTLGRAAAGAGLPAEPKP